MTNGERTHDGPFLNRNIERRKFLESTAKALGILGFVGASGTTLAVLMNRAETRSGKLIGQPIEGKQKELYFTDPLPDSPLIVVRKEPNLSNDAIVGYTRKGFIVEGQAHYGKPYPGERGLGQIEGSDRDTYGLWIKVNGVPIFKLGRAQEFVPVHGQDGLQVTIDGVFLAGNFAKALTEDDYQTLFRTTKQAMLEQINSK